MTCIATITRWHCVNARTEQNGVTSQQVAQLPMILGAEVPQTSALILGSLGTP